jgi:hypothetical protein
MGSSMRLYISQALARPDFSHQFPTYTAANKIIEHTFRSTRSRPGWEVVSGFGIFFYIVSFVGAVIGAAGLCLILLSVPFNQQQHELASLPEYLGLIAGALVVGGLTRLTRQRQEQVIAIHSGGLLQGTWLVYYGTIAHLETIDWTQVTEGTRYTDYSGCHIAYLGKNAEKETVSFHMGLLTRPHNRRDDASFRDLVTQIEWQIHGLRGKPFHIVPRPISDGDTE